MALADRVDILPPGSNRPQTKLRGFHAVVIHETDNEAAGANAKMHRRWLEQSRPDASFHFCVDADESLQILPDDEVCWAIGDGADQADDESFYTVSIEICVNDKARYLQACRRAAKVAAAVLRKKGAQPSSATVRQHGSYWSTRNPSVHKNCPLHLRNNDWGVTWTGFLGMVQGEYAAAGSANSTTDTGTAAGDTVVVTPFISEQGHACVTIDFGGRVSEILGVNVQDVGISAVGVPDGTFDRSVQANQGKPWVKRPA